MLVTDTVRCRENPCLLEFECLSVNGWFVRFLSSQTVPERRALQDAGSGGELDPEHREVSLKGPAPEA